MSTESDTTEAPPEWERAFTEMIALADRYPEPVVRQALEEVAECVREVLKNV